MAQCLSTFVSSRRRKPTVISNSFSLPDLIPIVRKLYDWIRVKYKEYRKQTETETKVEEKRKYLGVTIFSLSSKNQTCPERGKKSRQCPLCACWSSQSPWKQWALLIWPIPLSSVNSPRQHGPYHSSCKQGRTPGQKQLWGRLNDLSERVLTSPLSIRAGRLLCKPAQKKCFLSRLLKHTNRPPFPPVDSAHSAKLSPRLWLCN